MPSFSTIYLDTPVSQLFENGLIDRTVLRSCNAAKPPMNVAGDIVRHLKDYGGFSDVPGCRRPGKISEILRAIAESVHLINMPPEEKPHHHKRTITDTLINEANFDFLTSTQRVEILDFRRQHDYLPMFLLLKYFLNRPDANRNDIIMALYLGVNQNYDTATTLADIGQQVNLSRERVRQIAQTYTLPDQLSHTDLWKHYADHSTYFANHNYHAYIQASTLELPNLTFGAFATVIERATMMENIDDQFLARRGWVKEITAWVRKLNQLIGMTRISDNRINLEGLAMGGSLDTRLLPVVMKQIVPELGLTSDAPNTIFLPKNT